MLEGNVISLVKKNFWGYL